MSSVPRPSFRANCSRVRLNLNLATESDAERTELVTGYSTSSEKKKGLWPTVLGRLVHILDFFFFPGLCFAHVLHILLTSPQERQVGFAYKPWPNREVFRFPCPIFSDSQFFAFRWVDPFGIVSLSAAPYLTWFLPLKRGGRPLPPFFFCRKMCGKWYAPHDHVALWSRNWA